MYDPKNILHKSKYNRRILQSILSCEEPERNCRSNKGYYASTVIRTFIVSNNYDQSKQQGVINPWLRRQKDKKNCHNLFFNLVPRLEKGRLYTGYSLREHPFFSALVRWFHKRIHNRQNLKYYRLSKTRFTKTSLFDSTTSRKASS